MFYELFVGLDEEAVPVLLILRRCSCKLLKKQESMSIQKLLLWKLILTVKKTNIFATLVMPLIPRSIIPKFGVHGFRRSSPAPPPPKNTCQFGSYDCNRIKISNLLYYVMLYYSNEHRRKEVTAKPHLRKCHKCSVPAILIPHMQPL